LHREDGEKFLLRYCRSSPVWEGRQYLEYGYEIWIPKVVDAYFRETSRVDLIEQSGSELIWRAFYDAALGAMPSRHFASEQAVDARPRQPIHTDGDGFSLTSSGREWLANTSDQWFPTDAGRYVTALEKASKLCGDAFTQRAHEAARCNEAANYLACCVMCGAGGVDNSGVGGSEDRRQRWDNCNLQKCPGALTTLSRITGQLTDPLRDGVKLGFDLLKYWRDAAAHGHAVTEMEAYLAMFTLFRFAIFATDNWAELTA
jgi:hypothetical protein